MSACFVVFMHRENIKRLLAGQESKVSFKKKEKPASKKADDTASGEEEN